MTSSVFHKLLNVLKCDEKEIIAPTAPIDQQEPLTSVYPLQLDMQTPFVPYKRTILEEIPEELLPPKDESSAVPSTDLGIIEPPQLQDNKMEETRISPQLIGF